MHVASQCNSLSCRKVKPCELLRIFFRNELKSVEEHSLGLVQCTGKAFKKNACSVAFLVLNDIKDADDE